MSSLEVENLSRSFGPVSVLQGISMIVEDHSIACILGPSGCGKTTLLNILAGSLAPDGGEIRGLEGRTVSYVFQEPRLLPWKTVAGNVELVLREKNAKERRRTVDRFLAMVGLGDSRDRYPHQLSGGMRQRASIARAFAFPADILLMDEPLRALDLPLKLNLIRAFMDLWNVDRRTVVFVTHDVQEALLLGDEIFVLSGRPARVRGRLSHPRTERGRRLPSTADLELERRLYGLLLD